jgi:hypothetical protein
LKTKDKISFTEKSKADLKDFEELMEEAGIYLWTF